MKSIVILTVFLSSLFVLTTGCRSSKTTAPDSGAPAQLSRKKEALIRTETNVVLQLFKDGSYEELAKHVHPEKGVRFSAYVYVDPENDPVFLPEAFVHQSKSSDSLHWGWYDGSGDAIKLTFQEYINNFVYTADFVHAEKTVVNEPIGGGNTINNAAEIYPGKPYTVSWFSGFDPRFGGMDWCSLRLVYDFVGEKPYLIAVIHDQWTI